MTSGYIYAFAHTSNPNPCMVKIGKTTQNVNSRLLQANYELRKNVRGTYIPPGEMYLISFKWVKNLDISEKEIYLFLKNERVVDNKEWFYVSHERVDILIRNLESIPLQTINFNQIELDYLRILLVIFIYTILFSFTYLFSF